MSWFRETMLKAEAKADQFETWVKDSVAGAVDRTREVADSAVERTNEFADDYASASDSALRRIPGYSGYKNKEMARDSDRALRNEIAQKLDQYAVQIETIQGKAANERNTARVGELESVVQGLRNLANLVRSASYGYAGLFSDKPVDELALKQLRLFDEGMMVKVEALRTMVETLENDTSADVDGIAQDIAGIKTSLALRNNVIDEGRPAKPMKPVRPSPATEQAFATGEQKTSDATPLPVIDLGDAISILGDDHIVRAIIDLDAGSHQHRFVRLDNTPQMWLWFSTDSNHIPRRLLGADDPGAVTWNETTGKATISVPEERKRVGPGIIRATTDSTNRVQLEIDGIVQNFLASDVQPEDIEMYQAG